MSAFECAFATLLTRQLRSGSQGGAVIELRSPVICASDLRKLVHPAFWSWGTAASAVITKEITRSCEVSCEEVGQEDVERMWGKGVYSGQRRNQSPRGCVRTVRKDRSRSTTGGHSVAGVTGAVGKGRVLVVRDAGGANVCGCAGDLVVVVVVVCGGTCL